MTVSFLTLANVVLVLLRKFWNSENGNSLKNHFVVLDAVL